MHSLHCRTALTLTLAELLNKTKTATASSIVLKIKLHTFICNPTCTYRNFLKITTLLPFSYHFLPWILCLTASTNRAHSSFLMETSSSAIAETARCTGYFDSQNCEVEFLSHLFRGLRGNVDASRVRRWKKRDRLPISDK